MSHANRSNIHFGGGVLILDNKEGGDQYKNNCESNCGI